MENGDAVSRDCAALHLPPLDHDVQEHELCSYVDDLEKAVGAAREKPRLIALLPCGLTP